MLRQKLEGNDYLLINISRSFYTNTGLKMLCEALVYSLAKSLANSQAKPLAKSFAKSLAYSLLGLFNQHRLENAV